MPSKRKQIYDGATFEEVQALLLKVTRQLRTLAPPPHIVKELGRNEAWIELMMARCNGNLLLH